jgi:hypothetical protein
MLLSISEGVLLERAVASGLISAVDIAAARADQTTLTLPRKWGLLLDRLISRGKLTDEQVRQLHDELTHGKPGAAALDRTMDGGLARTMDGGPDQTPDQTMDIVQARTLDGVLAQTMDSGPDQAKGSLPVAPQSLTHSFPAPHWEKYEFVALLGRGGMGAVYRARDRRLGRLVALKFIHGDDPGLIQRFLQEARSQARLDHPFICKVFEVGTVDSKPYIAMELVDGRTLDRMGSQLSLSDKLQIVKDTAEALHHAHEQGIIHRDIKPSTDLHSGKSEKTSLFRRNMHGKLPSCLKGDGDHCPRTQTAARFSPTSARMDAQAAARFAAPTPLLTASSCPDVARATPVAHRESQFP